MLGTTQAVLTGLLRDSGGLGPDDAIYLRSDSTDGSTDFTGLDLGPNNATVTRLGTANSHEATNAISGYGATSLFSDAALTGAILVGVVPNLNVPINTDFTLEFWGRLGDLVALGQRWISSMSGGPGWLFYYSNNVLQVFEGAAWLTLDAPFTGDLDPHHFCVDRSGTGTDNTGIYVDGSLVQSKSFNGAFGNGGTTGGFSLMGRGDTGAKTVKDGIMDGIRLSNGTSLYGNAPFTPPTTPPI